MYEIFRKNLGLMIAPARENNTGRRIGPSDTALRTCADVGKRLTFGEEVGVNDELVEINAVVETEKPDGGREGRYEGS